MVYYNGQYIITLCTYVVKWPESTVDLIIPFIFINILSVIFLCEVRGAFIRFQDRSYISLLGSNITHLTHCAA